MRAERWILSAALLLCGCTGAEDGRVLTLAHGLDVQHPVSQAMAFLAKDVHERSQGKLRIKVYPGEQLGSEREALELVQLGILSMAKASAAPLEAFVPTMAVLGMPYLFRDEDHMWKVFRGPLGREILDAGAAQNLKGLCFYDAGARSFYTRERPIHTPADLEGLKIRVQKSQMAIRMIEAMGGSPTPIDWGELYSALQQGVVDGAENNRPSFYLSRHYDACAYYTLDEHLRQPDVLVIGARVWNDLSPNERTLLAASVDASVDLQRQLWAQRAQEGLAAVQRAGVEVIRPDKTPFREAVQSLWDELKDTPTGDLAARIQEVQ